MELVNNIAQIGQSENGKALTQSSAGVVKIGAVEGSQVLELLSHSSEHSALKLGNVSVTATGTEINVLKGIQSTTDDLNKLSQTSADGTAEENKALIVDANKDLTGIRNLTITGEISADTLDIKGTNISAIADEINKLAGVTPGQVEAGKNIVVDDNKDIAGFNKLSTASLTLNGVDLTSTAGELNKLNGVVDGAVTAGKVVIASADSSVSGVKDLSITGSLTDGTATLSGGALTNVNSIGIESDSASLSIKSNDDQGGVASIRMVSDNGTNLGDGLEIKTLSGVTSILSDHGTAGQYDKTIMSLTGSSDVLTSKVSVSGELTANKLSLNNGSQIALGDSGDLFIVHDGTNGKINNSTGSLSINTDTEGAAVNIGHSTSEVNIGDNLVVNGNILLKVI